MVPVNMPATGEAQPAGADSPLAVSLSLDPKIIAALMAEMHGAGTTPNPTGFAVSTASPEMIGAWLSVATFYRHFKAVSPVVPIRAAPGWVW